ncbi:amidase [Pannonibacter phragmitetus]|uniref:amidase n=1 Tax=Pannonibacter phragmitetus TaxID=121719 RepID=UPI003D2F04D0
MTNESLALTGGSPVFTATLALGQTGPRVAVKDCIDIAGTVTRCGSAAFDAAPAATAHADVVEALLKAGCRIIAKTNMHELAYGMTGVNARFGTPVNPRWPDIIPGGSSSGSAAAVAGGLVDFAIGTDTGGSIRQPAICCGVIGFKPTFGRISRKGASPAQSSLDCIGPFARSMDRIEQAMAALDGSFMPARLTAAPKLAITGMDAEPGILAALAPVVTPQAGALTAINLPSLEAAFKAGMTVIGRETAAAFGHLVTGGAPLGPDVKARIAAAMSITDEDLAAAEDVRARFTAEVDAVLATHDAILTPALPVVPPRLSQADDPQRVLPSHAICGRSTFRAIPHWFCRFSHRTACPPDFRSLAASREMSRSAPSPAGFARPSKTSRWRNDHGCPFPVPCGRDTRKPEGGDPFPQAGISQAAPYPDRHRAPVSDHRYLPGLRAAALWR